MCNQGKIRKEAFMNDLLLAMIYLAVILGGTVLLVSGSVTNFTFDFDRYYSDYEQEQWQMDMERQHLIALYGNSKTTKDCETLKEIQLELLVLDSHYTPLKNDIIKMAKDRYEILCQ
jgi:hypothetical protein